MLRWKRPEQGRWTAGPFTVRRARADEETVPGVYEWVALSSGDQFPARFGGWYPTLADGKRACEATPYALAQELRRYHDAANGWPTYYDCAEVSDDDALLLTWVKEHADELIKILEGVKR